MMVKVRPFVTGPLGTIPKFRITHCKIKSIEEKRNLKKNWNHQDKSSCGIGFPELSSVFY